MISANDTEYLKCPPDIGPFSLDRDAPLWELKLKTGSVTLLNGPNESGVSSERKWLLNAALFPLYHSIFVASFLRTVERAAS